MDIPYYSEIYRLISILEMYAHVFTGKRSGNVATRQIEKGTILLQEKPVLIIDDNYKSQAKSGVKTKFRRKYLQNIAKNLLEFQFVMRKFDELKKQDQDSVLEMSYFYRSSANEIQLLDNFLGLISGSDNRKDKLKIFYIFQTHKHNNALYVNASKFKMNI